MMSVLQRRTLLGWCALVVVLSSPAHGQQPRRAAYEELVALFTEWREFQRPKFVAGVPDYTAAAMAAQQRALPELQRRLAALDTSGWTRAQQVDWHIVRAEMNGLEFGRLQVREHADDDREQRDQPDGEGLFRGSASRQGAAATSLPISALYPFPNWIPEPPRCR